MFLFNFNRFFVLAAAALAVLIFAGCRTGSNPGDVNSSGTPPLADGLQSEVPFSTREPERFQAEIVVTAGGAERKTFVARDGASFRYDFNFGANDQLTTLQTDKNYLLSAAHKVYAESAAGAGAAPTDDWTSFLTTEWLNRKRDAKFEKLETSQNVTKYRVRFGESPDSESFVYVDEATGLAVKQESFATGGEPRSVVYAFELKHLKLEPDAGLFNVPADFRRVSMEEFRKIVQSGRKN